MKNQELHKLKTGELQRFVEHAKPFFEEHSSKIYAAAGVLLLLIIGTVYLKTREPADSKEWYALYVAVHSDAAKAKQEYATLAEESPDTTAGRWAALKLADGTLNTGLKLMFTDREGAKENIKRAGESYSQLANASGISDDIHERALYGMARVAEANCDGNTEDAIKEYQNLTKQFPDSIYTPLAKNRIEALEKDGAKQFYTWFSQETPTLPNHKGILDAMGRPIPSGRPPIDSKSGPVIPDTGKTDKKKEDKKTEGKDSDKNPFSEKTPDKKSNEGKPKETKSNPFEKKESDNKTTGDKKEAADKGKTEPKPESPKTPVKQ